MEEQNKIKRISIISTIIYVAILASIVLILRLQSGADAADVTLAWNAKQGPDIAGYRIYYGNGPGDYDKTITIDTIGISEYLIEGLGKSDWYFAVTAFNSLGIESDYSEEVYKAIN